MRANYPVLVLIGFLTLAVNPGFACSQSTDNYQYGQAEMVAAVQGTWRLTFSDSIDSGSPGGGTVTFTLAPGPSTKPAFAQPGRTPLCGNREFVQSAGACVSMSTLYLAGQVTAANPPIDTTSVTGSYAVYSLKYIGGSLSVQLGTTLHVSADLDATNAIQQTYTDLNGARVVSALERLP